MTDERRGLGAGAVVGVILILVGILVLVAQQLDFDWGADAWPLYVVASGVALLAIGLTQSHGGGLTMAGSIISVVGLILLYQNLTDHWESWAYAWALVAPTSIGLAQVFYGSIKGFPAIVETGRRMIIVGVGVFAAGAFFFEIVLGISGFFSGLREYAWPVLLIGLGIYLFVRRSGPQAAEPAGAPVQSAPETEEDAVEELD